MVKRDVITRDLLIVALLSIIILLTFSLIQDKRKVEDVKWQKNELENNIDEREALIDSLFFQQEKFQMQIEKLIIDRKKLINDYDSIIARSKNYENNYIIPVIPDDSLQRYFANYKYQPARRTMAGDSTGFREWKERRRTSADAFRSFAKSRKHKN